MATARVADPWLYPPAPGAPAVAVFVVSNGFHVDLVVPRSVIEADPGPAAVAARGLGRGPWISVGWGDERFYKESGVTLRRLLDGLRCLFWPVNDRTIVRMAPLAAPPQQVYRDAMVLRLSLSREGARRLVDRLDRSLVSAGGAPVLTRPPADDSHAAYLRSRERFSVLHLCTHWVAELLSAAGVPVTPVIDTTAPGLMLDLERRAGARPP